MKNRFFFLVLTYFFPLLALAETVEYVKGDGKFDFVCYQSLTELLPYHVFTFVLYYNQNSENTGFEMITDEALASGNGDIVYQIDVIQYPYYDANTLSQPQELRGCSRAPLRIIANEKIEEVQVNFFCEDYGAMGVGEINMDLEEASIQGHIRFPKGQSELLYPLEVESRTDFICTFTDL